MKSLSLTIAKIICSFAAATLVTSCATSKCDLMPPTAMDHETQVKANAAADTISTAIAKGSVGVDISHVTKDTYAQIDKDDVAFYILVKAADCASQRGDKEGASEWRKQAGRELAKRHQMAAAMPMGSANTLTKTESKILKKSRIKKQIDTAVTNLKTQ